MCGEDSNGSWRFRIAARNQPLDIVYGVEMDQAIAPLIEMICPEI